MPKKREHKTDVPREAAVSGRQFLSAFHEKIVIHLLLIAIIGLLAYSNTFNVPFMFDDKGPHGQIEDNKMLVDLGNFVQALKDPGHNFGDDYIFVPRRFIGYLSFALNYRIHGLSVTGYHIVNIAVHIANSILVYFLVMLTFKTPLMRRASTHPKKSFAPPWIAFFSAAIFAAHPIQTEAVTYIVQRFASLATMFYLISLLAYIKGRLLQRKSVFFYIIATFSAILAMLTKEIAFTLPIMVLVYELIFFEHSAKRSLALFLAAIIVVAGAGAFALGANGKSLGDILSDLSSKTRLQTDISRMDYLATQMRVITTYLRLLVLPVKQNIDYDYPISRSFFEPGVLMSFILLAAIFGLGIYFVLRAKSMEQSAKDSMPYAPCAMRLTGFGILWFFITLSVESSVIPISDVIFEHRVYLPSVGAFVGIVAAAFALMQGKKANPYLLLVVFGIIIATLSVVTYRRNMIWQNGVAMWEDVVSKSPGKPRALNNLAEMYVEDHRPSDAVLYLKKALAMDPNDFDAWNTLAYADLKLGAYDEALAAFGNVLKNDPQNVQALSDLAMVYFRLGNYAESAAEAQKAIHIRPDFQFAYNNLSSAYRKMGRYDDALNAAKQALMINRNFAAAYNNMGLAYAETKRFSDAEASFTRALEIDPGYAEAYNNLGGLYLLQRNYDAAMENFKKSIGADPGYSNAYMNLAQVYALKGDRSAAMQQYDILKSFSPQSAGRLRAAIENIFSSRN